MAAIEAIATTYLEADAATVEFTSIPATYQHLQLRISGRSDQGPDAYPSGYEVIYVQFGTAGGAVDTGTNYSRNYVRGSGGGTPSQYSYTAASYMSPARIIYPDNDGTLYSPAVVDIFDYANTHKNTVLQFNSWSNNPGSSERGWGSGMWDYTGAVDRIKFSMQSGHDWVRNTTFSLYGLNSS